MKNLKLALSAVAILALVGTSLAFRPLSADKVACSGTTTPNSDPGTAGDCDQIVSNFSLSVTGTATPTTVYCNDQFSTDCNTPITIYNSQN